MGKEEEEVPGRAKGGTVAPDRGKTWRSREKLYAFMATAYEKAGEMAKAEAIRREMEVTRQEQRGVGREAGREEEEEGRGDSRGKQKGQRKEETDGPQKATRRGERGGGTRM
ncbi:hypothetical protein NSK_007799 [Nannochloropsis salina CCMP1776]|uniref:Uncharacterized protein n=1 Tax=Nannochloropsis salina CCMP1776 TaxID=1027361 RepID=A0A4D9CNY6_9STRA|nr:hypothetical protein NSK_007799 [Nannochloropsis salina CCMP1776]|eukprot:TFJ80872.1 hypothetical protein NSK_007799 [Nannochloropsis salina CCMP1776]